MTKQKLLKILLYVLVTFIVIIISLSLLGTVVHATGLVDDTINVSNEYSKYSLSNYQLDFYVDNSWGWLPWNWVMALENRLCMVCMLLQILYGLFPYFYLMLLAI